MTLKILLSTTIFCLPLLAFSIVSPDTLSDPTPPLEIQLFEAEVYWETVEVSWACQPALSPFQIERFGKDNKFHIIGETLVTDQGLNKFRDLHPQRGINYYRLSREVNNGQVAHSNIVAIEYEPISEITLAPNPCQNDLAVLLYTEKEKNISCEVVNQRGQIVKNEKRELYTGANNLAFDVSQLPAGIYFWRLVDGNTITNRRFVKN